MSAAYTSGSTELFLHLFPFTGWYFTVVMQGVEVFLSDDYETRELALAAGKQWLVDHT